MTELSLDVQNALLALTAPVSEHPSPMNELLAIQRARLIDGGFVHISEPVDTIISNIEVIPALEPTADDGNDLLEFADDAPASDPAPAVEPVPTGAETDAAPPAPAADATPEPAPTADDVATPAPEPTEG
jgi:hypothetical protein